MSLNPFAASFIPQEQPNLEPLLSYPFFQQRLERFLFTHYRMTDVSVKELEIIMALPPIKPQTKTTTIFLGNYKGIPLLYEADRLDDPRTGKFVKVSV
jgi:hypothetical protein